MRRSITSGITTGAIYRERHRPSVRLDTIKFAVSVSTWSVVSLLNRDCNGWRAEDRVPSTPATCSALLGWFTDEGIVGQSGCGIQLRTR